MLEEIAWAIALALGIDPYADGEAELMQILLTEQEYKALHDEAPDLRRIIAHLVHQLGGDVVVNREDLLEYSFSIAPRKSSSSNRNAIGSWHIQSRKPDEPWVK